MILCYGQTAILSVVCQAWNWVDYTNLLYQGSLYQGLHHVEVRYIKVLLFCNDSYLRAVAKISSCWVNAVSRRGIVLSYVGISSFGSVFFLFPIREARAHTHSTQVKSLPPTHSDSPVSSSELTCTPYSNLCLILIQCAKKAMSDSLGLVDFAIGLVNSVFHLPDGQVMFFEEFEWQKNCEINSASQKVLGLVEMMSGLVNASFILPEWQAVKMIFFAPWLIIIFYRKSSHLLIGL